MFFSVGQPQQPALLRLKQLAVERVEAEAEWEILRLIK